MSARVLTPGRYEDLVPFGPGGERHSFYLGRSLGHPIDDPMLFTVTSSSDPSVQSRLLECAGRALAKIRSDYVPAPVDLGITPQGETYVATVVPRGIVPFVGASLASPRGFVVHLARALMAVHAAGFAHRDLREQTVAVTAGQRPLLFDGSYLHPIQPDGTVKSIAWARPARPSDAPETGRAALCGGVAADMYSFALLSRGILGSVAHPILEHALDPLPANRPASMEPVVAELERAWRQSN